MGCKQRNVWQIMGNFLKRWLANTWFCYFLFFELLLEMWIRRLYLLQYFGHLMRRADSLEKTLMLGKIEGRRKRGWLRTRWLDGIIDSMDIRLSKFREIVTDRERSLVCWSPWDHDESDVMEWLNNNNNLHLGWGRQSLHRRDAEQTPGYTLGLLGLQAAAPT